MRGDTPNRRQRHRVKPEFAVLLVARLSAVLLDTSALIYLFEDHNEQVASLVRQTGDAKLAKVVLDHGIASVVIRP